MGGFNTNHTHTHKKKRAVCLAELGGSSLKVEATMQPVAVLLKGCTLHPVRNQQKDLLNGSLRLTMVAMRPTYSFYLINPRTEKSQIVRFRECAGHGMLEDALPIHRLGNGLSSQVRTVDA